MKLTNFQIKLAWIVGIGSIICLWIAFPFIFKTLLSFYSFPEKFNEFGAFGDIYGSLNTLISSIALCAVAFSTWLQVTSLKETRETNQKQILLAEQSHQEQLQESKHAVFSNTFNTIINYKQGKYNSLRIKNKDSNLEFNSEEVFVEISLRFLWLLEKGIINDNSTRFEIGIKFDEYLIALGGKSRGVAELISYFRIYGDLFELIKRSDLRDDTKKFYRVVISNSMSINEQISLLWCSVNNKACSDLVQDSGIFNQFYSEEIMPFLIKFFNKNCFSHPDILSNWEKYEKIKTQP